MLVALARRKTGFLHGINKLVWYASLRQRVWVLEFFKFNPLFLTAFFEEETGFRHGITKFVWYRQKKTCDS